MGVLSKCAKPPTQMAREVEGRPAAGEAMACQVGRATPAHFAVNFESGIAPQGYQTFQAFAQTRKEVIVIPCVSGHAAWFFGQVFAATPEEVAGGAPVGIAFGPPDEALQMVPISCLVRWQKVWEDPAYIDIAQTWLLVSDREVERVTGQGRDVGGPVHPYACKKSSRLRGLKRIANECLICMRYPAEYTWSGCRHEHEGVSLVCQCCRNIIVREESKRLVSPKDSLPTPCPICKTMGRLRRFVRADPA